MTDTASSPPPASLAELAARMADELARLDTELGEVDLLVDPGQDRGRPPRGTARGRGRQADRRARRGSAGATRGPGRRSPS